MKILDSEFYGDKNRWFIGVITNNLDPKALGRYQVRIHGVHSPSPLEIPFEDLPWAYSVVPTTEGGTSGIGRIPQMLPGAKVFGIFMDGETSQLPLILGTLPKIELPSVGQIQQEKDSPNDYEYEAYEPNVSSNEERWPFDLDSRRSQGMKFFIDNGYTLWQAAGIMGNLEYESGLDTEIQFGARRDSVTGEIIINEDLTEKSRGIAQWNPSSSAGDRLGQLYDFAQNQLATPRDWRDYSVQLQFVLYELRNKESRANASLLGSAIHFGGASDDNSTYVFGRDYEKPNRQAFLNSLPDREALAIKAYDQHSERA